MSDESNKDKALVEYLHYKHYETCKECTTVFRTRQWERFGRLLRNTPMARKQQALGAGAAASAADAASLTSVADIDAASCAGSCKYSIAPVGWKNQRAWKRSERD